MTKTKQRFGVGKQLRREAPPKFYKNPPQKTTTFHPAKVTNTKRLATRPRPASPPLACGHAKQSARSSQKLAAAQPAPWSLAERKPTKAPLGLQAPRPQEAAPPIFTAHKAPRPAKAPQPSRSTVLPQPPQPRERPRSPYSTFSADQTLPDFQSPSLFQPHRRLTCLRRFSQPLSLPQNHLPSPLPLSLFALSALPPLPLAQRGRQRHGVFVQNDGGRRYFASKPPTLPHGVAVSAARRVRQSPTQNRLFTKSGTSQPQAPFLFTARHDDRQATRTFYNLAPTTTTNFGLPAAISTPPTSFNGTRA